ncbi:hypothetical protein ACFL23_00595 [Patescibacteria group bacterium]
MRKIISISIIIIATYFVIGTAFSQKKDAIGVKIIKNPEHSPVLVWYQNQNFIKGSPQPMLVDGYDGVKDGNTVYVNVANVVNPSNESFTNNVYTNIYVISYNEGAGEDVSGIFDQIISNWKFNSNISDGAVTRLNVSMKEALRRDTRRLADMSFINNTLNSYYTAYGKYPDLLAGTYIKGESMSKWPSWQASLGNTLGVAMPVDPLNTFYAFDICPIANCQCEKISEFYDTETCWNQQRKEFNGENNVADGLNNNNFFNAFVYYYKSSDNGMNSYIEVSHWETPYLDNSAFNDYPSLTVQNNNPVIESVETVKMNYNEENIIGMKAYDKDISTTDISWTLQNYSACLNNVSLEDVSHKTDGWSDNANRFESYKNVKIQSKSIDCDGEIRLTATDGDGGSYNYDINVDVKNMPALINRLSNDTGIVDTGNGDVAFTTEILTKNKDGNNLTWSTSGFSDAGIADLNNSSSNIISGIFNQAGVWSIRINVKDQYDVISTYQTQVMSINNSPVITSPNTSSMILEQPNWSFSIEAHDNAPYYDVDGKAHPHLPITYGLIDNPNWVNLTGNKMTVLPSNDIDVGDYNFTIKATDSKGAFSTQNFSLITFNNPPVITDYPKDGIVMRARGNFSYQIKASDPDGHSLTYSIDYSIDNNNLLQISQAGVITGGAFNIDDGGIYKITIVVNDGYKGGITKESFTLQLNSFCGDGKRQEPNMEKLGGQENDGYEQCDYINYNAPSNPTESSKAKQYICYSDCSFSINGIYSGWCGDGTVQSARGENCDPEETKEKYEERMGYEFGISDADFEGILASCTPECEIGCEGEEASELGKGCYIGANECLKGKMECLNNEAICVDVFTPKDGIGIYDYCCQSIEETGDVLKAQQDLAELRNTGILTRVKPSVAETGIGRGSYYCEDVCKQSNQICVGVAITDWPQHFCYAVKCDAGKVCTNSGNTKLNDCRTQYPFGSWDGDDCTEPEKYFVGYTSCLCYREN